MGNIGYEVALEKLHKLGTFGIKPGLERITSLLAALGNPEQKLRCIHVTGTNGKGSVGAMLESMLVESGYKVGKFTSPHLITYNERIIVQKEQITNLEFANLVERVLQVKARAIELDQPTQFEVLTAMAFLYFAEQAVDYAIIEVGMGGLLDSTNVIMPVCSVITNVSLDHMDKCGVNVSEIAVHKAGIIKPGVPVVTAATAEALEVIRKTAAANKAAIYIGEQDFNCQEISKDLLQQTIRYNSPERDFKFSLRLLGKHQLANAAVAIKAFELVTRGQVPVREIAQGLKKTVWSGRAEIVSYEPLVILDGAHNPAGAKVLRELLDDDLFKKQQRCFILGFMQDKAIAEIVDILCRQEDQIIIVKADPELPRAASLEQLKRIILQPTLTAQDYDEALSQAKKIVGPQGIICIAGSLYLIGNIKKTLLG